MEDNVKISRCQLLKAFLENIDFSFVVLIAMNQCMFMFKEKNFFANFGLFQLF